jgi:WhiB family transcriptional regulator, redox-sensing transcriptional regulator
MNNYHIAFFEEKSLCAEVDPDMWFPERRYTNDTNHYRTEESMQARAICGSCPANPECLEYSLKYSGLHGIWAGLDPTQRAKIQEAKGIRAIPLWRTIPRSSDALRDGVLLTEE